MNIKNDISLADYSTMGLGGQAKHLVNVSNKDELKQGLSFAKDNNIPAIMIGLGSNIVWRDEGYNGLVIVSDIKGIDLNWQDETNCIVTIGSGEIWDEVVANTVNNGLSGIECLSLIPGKAGATPVQNVGAYGQEIADTFIELGAYDNQIGEFVTIAKSECRFGYRMSRFKADDRGRFFITSIKLSLTKTNPKPPFYASLSSYLEKNNIADYSVQTIRDAVITIRSNKLPDPSRIRNNGSFFANPIISKDQYNQLAKAYVDIPGWPTDDDKVKVSAAWLIEQIGFKDYHDEDTGMATWARQPLVLVNESASMTGDLINFRNKIIQEVSTKFGITLTQEPELLPELI